jgi:lycopene cyclase domain-containing protein
VKEYTVLAIMSVVVVWVLDWILETRLTRTKTFWIFITVMFGFKLLVNGYLTWRPVVRYGSEFFINIRLFTIPLEDFLFGFSLITSSVLLWEYFKEKSQ